MYRGHGVVPRFYWRKISRTASLTISKAMLMVKKLTILFGEKLTLFNLKKNSTFSRFKFWKDNCQGIFLLFFVIFFFNFNFFSFFLLFRLNALFLLEKWINKKNCWQHKFSLHFIQTVVDWLTFSFLPLCRNFGSIVRGVFGLIVRGGFWLTSNPEFLDWLSEGFLVWLSEPRHPIQKKKIFFWIECPLFWIECQSSDI